MKIGIPKEIKPQETRVAVVPAGVTELVRDGHDVMVEHGAGEKAGYMDDEYLSAGATVIDTQEELFSVSDMIVKVKEPLPPEYKLIRPGQILFTYFHFAASEKLTRAMQESRAICLAYETFELSDGTLPLLTPMSEIAGRMAPQCGASMLERQHGGRGVLLGSVPGVRPSTVTIIGGGVAGMNAALIAAGMGAQVLILDINIDRLRYLSDIMPSNVITLHSNSQVISDCCAESDMVIGTVLIPGAAAPKLITREILRSMRPASVFVDISVDQGGCAETTRSTTQKDPVYVEENIVHYAVDNMPAAVGITATIALTNATLPYVRNVAQRGSKILEESEFRSAINMYEGNLLHPALVDQYCGRQ